jgi:hypothetical protein
LNGTTVTQAADLYQHRAYLETLLTYGTDTAASHLTNALWYPDGGDMPPCDSTKADSKNEEFVTCWNRIKQSKEFKLYGRIHSDLSNVAQFLISGVKLQTKFMKTKITFFLMNTNAESKMTFQFLETQLIVNRVRPNSAILLVQTMTPGKGVPAIYNLTSVELKTFTFSSGSQSLSIYNAIIGPIP